MRYQLQLQPGRCWQVANPAWRLEVTRNVDIDRQAIIQLSFNESIHFIITSFDNSTLEMSWSNYHSVHFINFMHLNQPDEKNVFSPSKGETCPMTLALTSWWIDCQPISCLIELFRLTMARAVSHFCSWRTNGWQLFDEFFSLPPQKKTWNINRFQIIEELCVSKFPHWRLGNIALVKSWKPPSRVKINWLRAAHLWSVPVLQTCTHGAATCENIGRPEMMQKLKTCRFREGPSANLPMKCGIWFKTCLGCCNQPVWS